MLYSTQRIKSSRDVFRSEYVGIAVCTAGLIKDKQQSALQ